MAPRGRRARPATGRARRAAAPCSQSSSSIASSASWARQSAWTLGAAIAPRRAPSSSCGRASSASPLQVLGRRRAAGSRATATGCPRASARTRARRRAASGRCRRGRRPRASSATPASSDATSERASERWAAAVQCSARSRSPSARWWAAAVSASVGCAAICSGVKRSSRRRTSAPRPSSTRAAVLHSSVSRARSVARLDRVIDRAVVVARAPRTRRSPAGAARPRARRRARRSSACEHARRGAGGSGTTRRRRRAARRAGSSATCRAARVPSRCAPGPRRTAGRTARRAPTCARGRRAAPRRARPAARRAGSRRAAGRRLRSGRRPGGRSGRPAQRERRQVQPGGPALGALEQQVHVLRRELEIRQAEHRRRLAPGHGQIARAEVDQPPLRAQAPDRQIGLPAAGEHELRSRRHRVGDRHDRRERLRREQVVQVVEHEHERVRALLDRVRQLVEASDRARRARRARARSRSISAIRVVVRLVDREPRHRPRVVLEPVRRAASSCRSPRGRRSASSGTCVVWARRRSSRSRRKVPRRRRGWRRRRCAEHSNSAGSIVATSVI